jgi:hypothetical protein
MDPRALGTLARFRALRDREIGPAVRRALLAVAVALVFGLAHVARLGTPVARAGVAITLALATAAMIVRALVTRLRPEGPRALLERTLVPSEPELGAAALRALALVERAQTADIGGSPALASLHLARLVGRASSDRVAARAAATATRWSRFALAAATVGLLAAMIEPLRVVEGLDVLAAQGGVAPLPIAYLEEIEVVGKPPDYLHEAARPLVPFEEAALPRGSVVTVRGRPAHDGRSLVLTDGASEVPFVDDGSGFAVAHTTLGESATYFVAARFGEVLVRQLDDQVVESVPDQVPTVTLEGAPRTARLLDEPSLSLRYEARDDHGLREVDLVLRTSSREERRVLSRPNAEAKVDRGGYELRASDPFFKRTYAPVEVTIEARDTDPVSGPRWGKSAAIVVVPPQVGEPEALRFEALEEGRDALVDLLAARLAPASLRTKEDKARHAKDEAAIQATAVGKVNEALLGSYGGLRVRGRAASLVRGQLRRLDEALTNEAKRPTEAAHQELVSETESVLLALDAALEAIGTMDARAVAKRLADVADEAAAAAFEANEGATRERALVKLDAASGVLGRGGEQLLRLSDLGLDLGEIVAMDLRRMARAREGDDYAHVELAARDLAARLRRPDPSFAGGGGGGGVESGSGGSGEPGEASTADREAAALEQQLEELIRDHAQEIGEVGDALDRATPKEQLEALRDEAKQRADAIREAIRGLPRSGGDAGSAEQAAAAAREQAEAMAAALEGGRPSDAVARGKGAVDALKEAERKGQAAGAPPSESYSGREAQKARGPVERELAWAEEVLERLRKAASERAKDDLGRSSGDEDKLAERARELARKGGSGDGAMPDRALENLEQAEQEMREATRALREGDGERGLQHQKDAQRLLEMARGERDEQDDANEGRSEGDGGRDPAHDAEIPDKDKHKGPDEFRKRVLRGLGGASEPQLRDAVKRYAEGLLR